MGSFFRTGLQGLAVVLGLISPMPAFAGSFHASYYRSITIRTYQPAPPPVVVQHAPVVVAQVQPCVRPCVTRVWGGRRVHPCRQVASVRRCGGFGHRMLFKGRMGRRCF